MRTINVIDNIVSRNLCTMNDGACGTRTFHSEAAALSVIATDHRCCETLSVIRAPRSAAAVMSAHVVLTNICIQCGGEQLR